MIPYLGEPFGIPIGSYGVMMALGFLVSGWFLARELRRRDLNPEIAWEIVLAGAIGGVVGARSLAILESLEDFDHYSWTEVLLSRGGLTWYGGFLGGAIGVIIVLVWRRLSVVTICDAASPELLLGYAFGRGGCQLSGDGCYGIATDLPWGMAYPKGIVPTMEHVHPTPLYEIVYSLVGFAFFWLWLRKQPLPRGAMFAIYLVYSSILRFLVEFIRINERYAGLSLSQWVGIVGFVWGTAWIIAILRGKTERPLSVVQRPRAE